MIQSSFRKPADLIASTVNYCHNSFSSFGRSSLCCLLLSLSIHCCVLFQRCTAFGNERVLVSIMFVVLFCYFIIYLFVCFNYLFNLVLRCLSVRHQVSSTRKFFKSKSGNFSSCCPLLYMN